MKCTMKYVISVLQCACCAGEGLFIPFLRPCPRFQIRKHKLEKICACILNVFTCSVLKGLIQSQILLELYTHLKNTTQE